MAFRGCKECVNAPALKCQKCQCRVCAEHALPWLNQRYSTTARSPYRLCNECHIDYLAWVVKSNYRGQSGSLCCLINHTDTCYYCKVKTCATHSHEPTLCPSWAKWKRTENSKETNCCLKKKKDTCSSCGYPTCGKHKTFVRDGLKPATQCQLCGAKVGYY